jgi:hypothetical protein
MSVHGMLFQLYKMPTKVVGLVQSGHNHQFVTGSGHDITGKEINDVKQQSLNVLLFSIHISHYLNISSILCAKRSSNGN